MSCFCSSGSRIQELTDELANSQTSIRSGRLLEMGKGFAAASGVLGQNLGDLITNACKKRVSSTVS
jgi:hypothetical protein